MEILIHIFLIILNMSITATYVAISIIAIRMLFFKKIPKIFSYSLWGILLYRLISPISFSSTFSFFKLLKPKVSESTGIIEYVPRNIEMMQSPTVDVGISRIDNAINASLPKAVETASMNPMKLIILIASVIWVIGIIGLIIYSIFSYVKVISNVKTAVLFNNIAVGEVMDKLKLKRKIKVYTTDQIVSPFVCGFIISKVYIPANISTKELSYILMHELVHVKRMDYIIKPLSYLILVLYWFNPILWLSFKLMSKDMEMSCDEKVMRILGNHIKQDYSNSLLSMAINENRLLLGSPLAFGESNVKSRIKNVLQFKKPSFFIVVIIVIVIGIIGYTLLSNPNSLNMSENFKPKSIEIDIDGGMKNIDFQKEESQNISKLLEYDTWEKAEMEYDLATMTYLSDGGNKVIGLYEDVDGYTYIVLYSGFNIRNGDYYKAPFEVYNNIEKYLMNHYFSSENTNNNSNNDFNPDVKEEIKVITNKTNLIKIGEMMFAEKLGRYMSDDVDDIEEIISYTINSSNYLAGDINEFVIYIEYDLEPKVENSNWQAGNGIIGAYRELRIKKVADLTYQLIGFGTGGYASGLTVYKPFKYSQIKDICKRYGYQSGIILELNNFEKQLLLYNHTINNKDDLLTIVIKLDSQNKIVEEQEVYLPEQLNGYSVNFKYGDCSQKKYLLGYRSVIDTKDKKLYSDLLVFDKTDLSNMTILQSYSLDYDESIGKVPQGDIPTVIDFSVDIIDDYIVYEDVDLYWKVQDVRSKKIFSCGENNPRLDEVEPVYLASGEYIYVLKYAENSSILAFNTNTKKFEILKNEEVNSKEDD